MKIVDNFLPEPFFKKLEGAWCDGDIPWCYNQGSTYNKKREWAGPSQFTHIFYSEDPWHRVRSPYYDLVKIIPDLLGAKKNNRIRGTLQPRTFFPRGGGYHTDYMDPPSHRKTAVYYINSNNGCTQFKRGGKVKSVANRLVIFDCNILHQGVTCTDKDVRVVLNFNYE